MDADQSSSGDKSASSGGSSNNDNNDNHINHHNTLGHFEDLVRQSRAQRAQRAQRARARAQQRTAAGSTTGGGGNTRLGPTTMFLCGVVFVLATMYLLKFLGGGSAAADHRHDNNINDELNNGGDSGGFFHLSERRRGTPRGSTWDAVHKFAELEDAAEQVSAMLNGSSTVSRQALDTVMEAATGDYDQLRYVGVVLNSTRSAMMTAADLGHIAARTFEWFFFLVESSNTRGTAAVERFERMVASVKAQVRSVKETLSGQALCPNLERRLEVLRSLETLLVDYEEELERRLARPAGYLDNWFTAWLAGRTTVAAMEREQAAFKHLRDRVKDLIHTLETSTQVLDKYVGELKELIEGGVVRNADGWTQMKVLRDMAKAGDKGVGKLVGANYGILLDELEKVRLVMS
ncbi:hypothetical protein IWX90DRAFT_445926 [Phyllosticta citrichinensis]|uniref:Transmembrane protein n=1 Tax=Phyllosticta citrichinensis TaxID=1130410 RepID=A0ABR1XFF4_9PEZI